MPRIQIIALPKYDFRIQIVVRTTDLNYGGHLGNDRLLSLMHEARVAFLASHDWTELDCAGVSMIMGDSAIVYRGEAFAGDILVIEMSAGQATNSGYRLYYRITRKKDAAKIALAETGMICFDYEKRKIVPLPDEVRQQCTHTE